MNKTAATMSDQPPARTAAISLCRIGTAVMEGNAGTCRIVRGGAWVRTRRRAAARRRGGAKTRGRVGLRSGPGTVRPAVARGAANSGAHGNTNQEQAARLGTGDWRGVFREAPKFFPIPLDASSRVNGTQSTDHAFAALVRSEFATGSRSRRPHRIFYPMPCELGCASIYARRNPHALLHSFRRGHSRPRRAPPPTAPVEGVAS